MPGKGHVSSSTERVEPYPQPLFVLFRRKRMIVGDKHVNHIKFKDERKEHELAEPYALVFPFWH